MIFYFPLVSDSFSFWRMSDAVQALNNQNVVAYSDPGFLIIVNAMSYILGINHVIMPVLPLQAIYFIIFIILILKKLKVKIFIVSLIILSFITAQYFYGFFMFWDHGLGALFLLQIIFLLACKSSSINNNDYLIIFILIVSLNLLSYKMVFSAIVFLFFFRLSNIIGNYFDKKRSIHSSALDFLILFCLVYVMIFNEVFYKSFIPALVSADEPFSIIIRTIFRFQQMKDPLSAYYLKSPLSILIYLNILWLLIIFFISLFEIIFILFNIVNKKNYELNNNITLVLIMVGIFNLIVYSYLGTFDLSLLLLLSILGSFVLYVDFINLKKILIIFLVMLISINIIFNTIQCQNNLLSGERDLGMYSYIDSFASWYLKNVHRSSLIKNNILSSDVFTSGYIALKLSQQNLNPNHISNFNQLHISFIFNISGSIPPKNSYVINYKLHSITAANWQVFNSFSNYEHFAISDPRFLIVYNNNYINFIEYYEKPI